MRPQLVFFSVASAFLSLLLITCTTIAAVPNSLQGTPRLLNPMVLPARSDQATRVASDTLQLHLPLIRKPAESPIGKLGSDFGNLITATEVISQDFPLAAQMGATWSRIELPWLKIEPEQGLFAWEPYDAVFDRLRELHVQPLVLIHSIPEWASDQSCGPVTDWTAFEDFLNAAIDRYGDVAGAWEFMNEPDGKAPNPLGPTIGCWAPYPEKYAEQLALFYAIIKQKDPEALVFHGGLAYDNWELFDRDFLTNTLANGAGPYFDGVSLHFYPINPVDFPTIADKINEVRSTLDRNLLWNKRIWITETSMWSNGGKGLEAQKDFIVQDQTRGLCAGADNLFWFAIRQEPLDPPLHRWLISRQHQPDQGYSTYQFYARQLEGATCLGRVNGQPEDVEAYRFLNTRGETLYIIWSNGAQQNVTLPATTHARSFDRDGGNEQIIPANNGMVSTDVSALAQFIWIDR